MNQALLFTGLLVLLCSVELAPAHCTNGIPCLRRRLLQAKAEQRKGVGKFNEEGEGEKSGSTVAVDIFPYVASLSTDEHGVGYCGGVLVGPNMVLTSAICVKNEYHDNPFPEVLLPSDKSSFGEVFQTCKTIVHEGYNKAAPGSENVALLILDRDTNTPGLDVAGPKFIQKSGAPQLFMGRQAAMVRNGGLSYSFVESVNVELVTDYHCSSAIKTRKSSNLFCGQSPKKDACHGKSGAPLLSSGNAKGSEELIGILLSSACKAPHTPNVYISTNPLTDWVHSQGTAASEIFVNENCKTLQPAGQGTQQNAELPTVADKAPSADLIIQNLKVGDKKTAARLILLAAVSKGGREVLMEVAKSSRSQEDLVAGAQAVVLAFNDLETILTDPVNLMLAMFKQHDISESIRNNNLNDAARAVATLSNTDGPDDRIALVALAKQELKDGFSYEIARVLVTAVMYYDADETVLTPAIEIVIKGLG